MATQERFDRGSIELVVLGLLAALIVVLAIPLFAGIEETPRESSAKEQAK